MLINIRDYYPFYTRDYYINARDEVVNFLQEDKRRQTNYEQYIRDNRAFYSLDCGDGIEADALFKPATPEELFECTELSKRIHELLAELTAVQRNRIIRIVFCGESKAKIASAEGVNESAVRAAINRGLSTMKNSLKKSGF